MHLIFRLTRVVAHSRLPSGSWNQRRGRTRYLGWCGLLWLLWSVTSAQAGLIGYPAPQQVPLFWPRIELTGDSFKTDLKSDREAEATTGRALVTVSLGLTPWIELYARTGLAEFNIDNADFKGDFGFAYGGGVRLRAWEFPFARIGLLGQYLRFTSDDANSLGRAVDGEWEEFDLGLGIGTRQIGVFQFYSGVTYHKIDVTLDASDEHLTLEQDIPILVFIGFNILPLIDFPRGEFRVNVEARLIGETPQFTLGLQYQFGVTRNRTDR